MAAYRRDLFGVARRIGAEDDVGVLRLEHLTKAALREAFASWASNHAAASVLRALRRRSAPASRRSPEPRPDTRVVAQPSPQKVHTSPQNSAVHRATASSRDVV